MSKVITFSRTFPAYHPKAGKPTYFVEKFGASLNIANIDLSNIPGFDTLGYFDDIYQPKHHTIRAGARWKAGDKFSPRVWAERPYNSPQIIIAPDITIVNTWDFEINSHGIMQVNGGLVDYDYLASNDGLAVRDLMEWFRYPKPFKGQIICWNESIKY